MKTVMMDAVLRSKGDASCSPEISCEFGKNQDSAASWIILKPIPWKQPELKDFSSAPLNYSEGKKFPCAGVGLFSAENSKIPEICCKRQAGRDISNSKWSVVGFDFMNWRNESAGIQGIWGCSRILQRLCRNDCDSDLQRLHCLVQITQLAFARLVRGKVAAASLGLTERELEVMRWTADGKSAQDVADILRVSKHTVDFHIRNSMAKLQAPNKTAAVVRAALLGLLS